MPAVAIAAAVLALLQPAVASADAEAARHAACLKSAETDPEAAYEAGLAWLGEGSRPLARHCLAMALVALGKAADGAAALEELANAPDAGGLEARGLYLAQAGNAWLAAGYPQAAVTALGNALKLRSGDAGLLKDRAAAHLALRDWAGAESDLDAALVGDPGDAEALSLRARARLGREAYDLALADVEAARAAEPGSVALLVLRGDIREARRKARE